MNEQNETLACLIEYTFDSADETFMVSFEESIDGGSKRAKFSTLDEALGYAQATFPTVIEKWRLSHPQ